MPRRSSPKPKNPGGPLLRDLIKQLRRQRRLSYRALANELGLSHSTVGRWESGDGAIGRDGRQALANFCGCSIERIQSYLKGELKLSEFLEASQHSRPFGIIASLIPQLSQEELLKIAHLTNYQAVQFYGEIPQEELLKPLLSPPPSFPAEQISGDSSLSAEHSSADSAADSDEFSASFSESFDLPLDLPLEEAFNILRGFLNALIDRGRPNGYSLAEIAEILDQPSDQGLITIVEKIGNGNGERASRS